MSKKAKGIIKFLVACGIVVSAAFAVVAILSRMRAKLRDPEVIDDDAADDDLCDGSCETCGMCDGGDAEEEETDEEADGNDGEADEVSETNE